MSLKEVYITRTASFLPNEPISNDEMEDYLGLINDRASKSRRIVLRNNGIKNRYYAIQKDGTPTHTNAEMVSLAIRKLFERQFHLFYQSTLPPHELCCLLLLRLPPCCPVTQELQQGVT